MKANAQQLKEIIRRIVEATRPRRIILFGSVGRGQMTKNSDIDLMVVMPTGTHRRHTAQFLYDQLSGVGIPVDIMVATEDDLERHRDTCGLVYREALREGEVIYDEEIKIRKKWKKEIARRCKLIEEGKAKYIEGKEAFRRLYRAVQISRSNVAKGNI
ncbi:MAG: nucleotidyltransferase domain-containing protein [Candidatus Sumerlaeota bacterium]|nr:nucleotidyltransferase domain-containing protein [Candidatus Sumerlaeota bacterium]